MNEPDTSPKAVPSSDIEQCSNESRALFEQWARTEFEDEFDGDRMDNVEWAWCAWQAARIAAPVASSADTKKNAARYHWLRTSGFADVYVMVGSTFESCCGEGMDAAIDAAMEAK